MMDIYEKKCVVIGGGRVAERRVRALLACHGKVHVISPDITGEFENWVQSGRLTWEARRYMPGDCHGAFLVLACTDDRKTNGLVAKEAGETGALVNVADSPDESNFIFPSTVRRGGLTFAISTEGKNPALCRRIRERLEDILDTQYEAIWEILRDAEDEREKSSNYRHKR
ncbi:MAG: bifunctional precorrin-2 dehydrogenase/sirohydrochlorin ferrochelatase [Firmicutes bacterium]|nr:bifunctional precorrin-2 dehydrogenase/sirohydrochlorin ferrochelatase [Bacillota bacterium]